MRVERRIQIYVRNYLSVDDDKCFLVQKVTCIIQCAASPQNYWLFYVIKADAKLSAVPKRIFYRVWSMMKVDHNFATAESCQVLGDISHQRLSQNWQSRLSAILRQRPKPCTIPGGKNHRAHVGYSISEDCLHKGITFTAVHDLRKRLSTSWRTIPFLKGDQDLRSRIFVGIKPLSPAQSHRRFLD